MGHSGSKQVQVALFASGTGSNADTIIQYFKGHPIIRITLMVTNNPASGVFHLGIKHRIEVRLMPRIAFEGDRNELTSMLREKEIDFVVLAGFLQRIPPNTIKMYKGKILNIHPALLPKFGGKGMYGIHVHKAVIEMGETESGITIHEVTENYDEGKAIIKVACSVNKNDSPETLQKKIQTLEHEHYSKVIEHFILQRYAAPDMRELTPDANK